jgi:hypothetical protein
VDVILQGSCDELNPIVPTSLASPPTACPGGYTFTDRTSIGTRESCCSISGAAHSMMVRYTYRSTPWMSFRDCVPIGRINPQGPVRLPKTLLGIATSSLMSTASPIKWRSDLPRTRRSDLPRTRRSGRVKPPRSSRLVSEPQKT